MPDVLTHDDGAGELMSMNKLIPTPRRGSVIVAQGKRGTNAPWVKRTQGGAALALGYHHFVPRGLRLGSLRSSLAMRCFLGRPFGTKEPKTASPPTLKRWAILIKSLR